ncbi:MAG: hypothetical protein SF069_17885 [Phycisphaerae bacterium]|nr:hypothetical protein [Phycisphaerae bacterium]
MSTPFRRIACGILSAALGAAAASAAIIRVQVNGTVDFNVIGGGMAGVPSGAPVTMAFDVDSTNVVDSPNFPTRGYPILLSSWAMSVAGVNVPIRDPQPAGAAYFVLRNNDPAVDGFLISSNIEFPVPISVNIPGLAAEHELDFLRTFNDSTPLPSLDILDAAGTYGTENLSSFNWTIGRFGNAGAAYNYESITITPEPVSFIGLAALGLACTLRRR